VTVHPGGDDIADHGDIEALVSAFYRRAFADELLGPIFVDVARMDLPAHLPVMCEFWASALLRTGSYQRNALRPHLRLNAKIELTPAHFQRWLALWSATVDERHHGEKAELAKVQATRIAGALTRRCAATARFVTGPSRASSAEATRLGAGPQTAR